MLTRSGLVLTAAIHWFHIISSDSVLMPRVLRLQLTSTYSRWLVPTGNSSNIVQHTMLRRKPTAITLTSEDVTAYAESRLARNSQQENIDLNATGNKANGNKQQVDPNDELRPLPSEKARIVRTGISRDERIGAGRV